MSRLSFSLRLATVSAVAVLSSGCILNDIPLGTGYAAKYMCSGLWVSGLDEDRLRDDYIAPQVSPLPLIWEFDIDYSMQTVSVRDRLLGQTNRHTAYFREGIGCTLVQDEALSTLDDQAPELVSPPTLNPFTAWPHGSSSIAELSPYFDHNALDQALESAFVETDEEAPRNTLAVAVVHRGTLVAERYADHIDRDTPLLSWSMAKTITAMGIGALVSDQRLNPAAPAPVDAWAGTEKADITLEHLLHMSAGLQWNEAAQGDDPDQGYGLFEVSDMAAYYADKPVESAPGTVFNYSTGQSNLLARIAQQEVGGTLNDYYQFINQALFQPLGITSAVVEFDVSGHPVGGAFHYLTARDWARLGLLLQRNGDWFGEQVLPAQWVAAMTQPSSANPSYGYQTWLNTDQAFWPSLPAGTFAMRGFQGQVVMIIPEHELVIVRAGVTFTGDEGAGIEALAQDIIRAKAPR